MLAGHKSVVARKHVRQLGQYAQYLLKLKSDKISTWRGGGGHEVPPSPGDTGI